MKEGLEELRNIAILIIITIPLSMSWQIGKLLGIRVFFKICKRKEQ